LQHTSKILAKLANGTTITSVEPYLFLYWDFGKQLSEYRCPS
jgi:hypothetical protein